MVLEDGQKIISLLVAADENQTVLTATENGFGKRTLVSEYTRHGRGTKGMISIQTTERNGKAVAAVLVDEDDQIMMLSLNGKIVRTSVKDISILKRATQGVTLIGLKDDALAAIQRLSEDDVDESVPQETPALALEPTE